jgi:hypothetical protein
MTLQSERLGDKGQRYAVMSRDPGDVKSEEHALAYTNDPGGAQAVADAWRRHSEGYAVWVVDRERADLAADRN